MSKDKRAKNIFKVTVEWSDYSPHSPTRTGQLPLAAIVPTGERVDLHTQDIQVAAWQCNVPYAGWVKMGHGVNAKESGWGDDGSRAVGCSGATVEVLAPEGTKFIFEQGCNDCGDTLGEVDEDELIHGRAPEVICADCQAEEAEMQAEQERILQEERDYYQPRTFAELEQLTGVRRRSLTAAADKGTLDAHKSGGTWLSSIAAVEDAIAGEYIRSPKK